MPRTLRSCLVAVALTLGAVASADEPPGRAASVDPPALAAAFAPRLSMTGRGVFLSWIERRPHPDSGGVTTQPDDPPAFRVRCARFDATKWSEPSTIIETTELFANWADVPSVTSTNDGTLFAHWLQRSGPDTYAYDVRLARSDDHGRSWTLLGAAHDDGTRTEHGFVSLVPAAGGVRAFWLDGREMAGDDVGHGHAGGPGSMTLRTALVGRAVTNPELLDERVCECCATDAAVTPGGPLIVYRDRSPDERRDIAIVRRLPDGRWSKPALVHEDGWQISGCPVNGPAIAAHGNRIAVAWFTDAALNAQVKVAFSDDGGATFADPVVVASDTLGRVDLALRSTGEAIVTWLEPGGADGLIRLRAIAPGGTMTATETVAATTTHRSSGFPQLVALDRRLLVAWTEDAEPPRLRAVVIDVPNAD